VVQERQIGGTGLRIRHPTRRDAAFSPKFAKIQQTPPFRRISADRGNWQHSDPLSFFGPTQFPSDLLRAAPGPQSTGTGKGEKTNPCGAVKPEITGVVEQAEDAANRFFKGLPIIRSAFSNRPASAANLKFLSVSPQVLHRNFKFKTALETYIY
jgi:hypothetical protein